MFWGRNLGLVTFTVGLLADAAAVKRAGTPLMGAAILLGLLTAATRVRAGEPALVETV